MNLIGSGWGAMVGLVNTQMNLYGHKRWLFTVKHKGQQTEVCLPTVFHRKSQTPTYQPAMHKVKRKAS
jgi:hypothetical protein